jgi:[ribosomal protein S18]-alanine N-acetyltransferase
MDAQQPEPLELRSLSPAWRKGLEEFCRALEAAGETKFFAPHPFSETELDRRVHYLGRDRYYLLVEGARVVGYGMLRGWDEGYAVPSLGIAIHPQARSRGYGELMMHFLHAAARLYGAERVRLRVHRDNANALELYRRLGYSFGPLDGAHYVGHKELNR